MSTASLLWQAAGTPTYDESHAGICRACGESGRGLLFDGWVKDTFTDHNRLLPGDILCAACQFTFDDAQPLLTQRTGKDKPQRMRNYSHFVVGGKWLPLSKGQKREMLACLRRNPTAAVIATSGQKHIIFRAQAGWWQVEEQGLLPNLRSMDANLALVEPLYAVFSKEEIDSGRYQQKRMMEFGLAKFLQIETALKAWRGSVYFDLALFLAQKEEIENGGIPGAISPGAEAVDSAVARPERGIQTEVRTQYLEPIRGSNQGGGIHQSDEQVSQLPLFQI